MRGLQGALSPSRRTAIATVAELSSAKNISGQPCVAQGVVWIRSSHASFPLIGGARYAAESKRPTTLKRP